MWYRSIRSSFHFLFFGLGISNVAWLLVAINFVFSDNNSSLYNNLHAQAPNYFVHCLYLWCSRKKSFLLSGISCIASKGRRRLSYKNRDHSRIIATTETIINEVLIFDNIFLKMFPKIPRSRWKTKYWVMYGTRVYISFLLNYHLP